MGITFQLAHESFCGPDPRHTSRDTWNFHVVVTTYFLKTAGDTSHLVRLHCASSAQACASGDVHVLKMRVFDVDVET